jgi:hypothetical protein
MGETPIPSQAPKELDFHQKFRDELGERGRRLQGGPD